jgi:hypothetical protein
VAELDPEDAKLVTLARATRARTGAPEAAALRDRTGRTYTAGAVRLPSLQLSALQAAVVVAAASAADGAEAAVLVTDDPAGGAAQADRAALRELGGGEVTVLVAGADGQLRA